MASSSPFSFKHSASQRSACASGLVLVRVEHFFTACVAALLPALFYFVLLGAVTLALWHIHLTVMVINFGSGFGVHDGLLLLGIVGESVAAVLLARQLPTPEIPQPLCMELLKGDQPDLFELIRLVSEKVRAPMPATVVVDCTARVSADFTSPMGTLRRRGLRLNLGLYLPVGVTVAEMAGLFAHELAFFSRGSGVASARFVRGVHRWFQWRIRHDAWLEWLGDRKGSSSFLRRWSFRVMWACVWLSLRPLRLLYTLCRLLTGGMLAEMVKRADACAARVVGSATMEHALMRQGLLQTLGERVHGGLRDRGVPTRLPDCLPLLLSRRLMIDMVTPEELPRVSHWLDMAPRDVKRRRLLLKHATAGMVEGPGEATTLFRHFHELSRQATYFHYQNTWGLVINEHRLVAVEETVHDSRASAQTVAVLNHYFLGLAHPERAFCGIAEEHNASRDLEVLKMELQDCREWLAKYGERMAVALLEWSKTWRLLRDLQTACLLTQAGMPINSQQFCVNDSSTQAFLEEIERQRHIMDTMEGVLRQYEGRLETRIATSLELLWRSDSGLLPPALKTARETLPHWVLIYESLGLNLPVLRELMTQFYAFQSLGAIVSGTVVSYAYGLAVSTSMPAIVRLVRDVLEAVGQWPYPFKTSDGQEGLSLADFIAPEARGVDLAAMMDPWSEGLVEQGGGVMAQRHAKVLCGLVAPLIDRYLSLYHQSFAWVTKASDLAESMLFNPFEEERLRQAYERNRVREAPGFLPPLTPQSMVDPELMYASDDSAVAA